MSHVIRNEVVYYGTCNFEVYCKVSLVIIFHFIVINKDSILQFVQLPHRCL